MYFSDEEGSRGHRTFLRYPTLNVSRLFWKANILILREVSRLLLFAINNNQKNSNYISLTKQLEVILCSKWKMISRVLRRKGVVYDYGPSLDAEIVSLKLGGSY